MARILIAEDDPLVSSLLEKGLRANGFSTTHADDGERAQQLAMTDEFDLMILDMGLPEREGFQVLQEIRSRGKTLPILVLTGRRERDVVACLEAGADDYMQKPFRFAELLARVRSRLRIKEELDRMERRVDDLQLLTEAERPGFLQREWIDLGPFTRELMDQAAALGSRRWTLDRIGEGMVLADRHRLTEAVMTLAHNAVEHTVEHETVAIGTSQSEGETRLWVRNSGAGIPAPESARTNRGPSHDDGVGLEVVRAIVKAHGGRVELESRLGQGSTFTIVLPRQPSEGAPRWPES